MAIYRLIPEGSFDPETVEAMTWAYESALVDLRMVHHNDPLTDLLAIAIITVARTGERSPEALKARAFNALDIRKIDAV